MHVECLQRDGDYPSRMLCHNSPYNTIEIDLRAWFCELKYLLYLCHLTGLVSY